MKNQLPIVDISAAGSVQTEELGPIDGSVLPAVREGKGSKIYKLVEIFHSTQGEGGQCGLPMLFVRFSKCNLACTWCDTPYNRVAIEIAENQLHHIILGYKPSYVMFTGGEPCLQLSVATARSMALSGIRTSIETNGMVYNEALRLINYITVSPKLGEPLHADIISGANRGEIDIGELRYTITGDQRDIWRVGPNAITVAPDADATSIQSLTGIAAHGLFISPVMDDMRPNPNFVSGMGFSSPHGKINQSSLARCQYLVHKYRHLRARLSIQVHKLIGAR